MNKDGSDKGTRVQVLAATVLMHAGLALGSIWSNPASGEISSAAGGVTVAPGDTLQTRGLNDVGGIFSGQFRVWPDGTIIYPVLGRIMVSGQTGEQVSQELFSRLSQQVDSMGLLYVSLTEFAPVYLLGDVMRGGPIEFQPGMSASDLLRLGGGLAGSADLKKRVEETTLEVLELQPLTFSLMTQRARLLAELRGEDFSPASAPVQSTDFERNVVENQIGIFRSHRASRDSQETTYTAKAEMYDAEIRSLRETIRINEDEVRILADQVKSQESLTVSGLATRSNLIGGQMSLATRKRQALEYMTELFRAEQNKLSAARELDDLKTAWELRALESLQDLEPSLQASREKLADAQRRLAQRQAEFSGFMASPFSPAAYTLTRLVDGSMTTIAVDGSMELQRGDVLRVELRGETAVTEPEAARSGENAP